MHKKHAYTDIYKRYKHALMQKHTRTHIRTQRTHTLTYIQEPTHIYEDIHTKIDKNVYIDKHTQYGTFSKSPALVISASCERKRKKVKIKMKNFNKINENNTRKELINKYEGGR